MYSKYERSEILFKNVIYTYTVKTYVEYIDTFIIYILFIVNFVPQKCNTYGLFHIW